MSTEQQWERLGRLAEARRRELVMTQEEVAAAGGPSTATQRIIEAGRQSSYRGSTLRDLEVGLGWTHGSVAAILASGDPVAATGRPPAGAQAARRQAHEPAGAFGRVPISERGLAAMRAYADLLTVINAAETVAEVRESPEQARATLAIIALSLDAMGVPREEQELEQNPEESDHRGLNAPAIAAETEPDDAMSALAAEEAERLRTEASQQPPPESADPGPL